MNGVRRMSDAQSIVSRCASMGRAAALQGEPLTENPWPPETVGGKAWAFGWHYAGLPWWLRGAARVLGWVTQ